MVVFLFFNKIKINSSIEKTNHNNNLKHFDHLILNNYISDISNIKILLNIRKKIYFLGN